MSNFIYSYAKKLILDGDIDFINDSIKAVIVNSGYTANQALHQFKSDIGSSNIESTSSNFTNKSTTAGVFDASDLLIENYNGNAFSYILVYKDTGNDSTSPLILYIDTAEGLPFQGVNATANITIEWSNTVQKIFSL